MADWGAFTRGLAGTTAQLPHLMMQTQALRQQEEKAQQEQDLKMAQFNLNIMKDDMFDDAMKVKAYNNFSQLAAKHKIGDFGTIEQWESGFKGYAKKGFDSLQAFKEGKIDWDMFHQNINSLMGTARNEKQQKEAEKVMAQGATFAATKKGETKATDQMPQSGVTDEAGRMQVPYSEEQRMQQLLAMPKDQREFIQGKNPDSIEKILAQRVSRGEMTLEETLAAKKEGVSSSKYKDFSAGFKAQLRKLHPDWSEEQVAMETANEADRRGLEQNKVIANIRIPAFQQASDLPPGYTFNRRSGKYVDPTGQEVSPQEFADLFTEKAGLTGGKQSIAQQEKVIGMMDGFVRNINKQVDRTDEIAKDLVKRVGVRALDLPIRKLKMGFIGSGEEAILEAYTIEISNEIGKLSTGSAASIRELSVDAQKQWAKIHDPNLSFNELVKVLKETKKMGNMRLQSSQEAIKSTKNRMKNSKNETEQEDPLGIR